MSQKIMIKRHRPTTGRLYGNPYAPIRLTYQIIEGLYDRTVLNSIIQTLISNIIPPYFTLTVEGLDGKRMPELEKECAKISQVINRTHLAELEQWHLLHGTALDYCGNVDEEGNIKEIFLLHPADVQPKFYDPGTPNYGEIEYWIYSYNNQVLHIPPDDINIYAHDANIGELYGRSIVAPLQDTLVEFLNNRRDLAEVLNRYAIPIVQWAVDVTDVESSNQDTFIRRIERTLKNQLAAGDDLVLDARIEPRTLSFAQDVGHLIQILDASRKDLGMLGVPESLMGGQISNLSGGKTQAAVFMVKVNKYRAILNDYLAEKYYIPHLEKKGKVRGEDYHNVYIAFPRATTELPSDKIIEIKTSVEMGFITPNEARLELGYRGAAPGVTPELEEIFKVRSIQYNTDGQTDPGSQKTKVDEPKKRDGKDPDKKTDSSKKSTAGDK